MDNTDFSKIDFNNMKFTNMDLDFSKIPWCLKPFLALALLYSTGELKDPTTDKNEMEEM